MTRILTTLENQERASEGVVIVDRTAERGIKYVGLGVLEHLVASANVEVTTPIRSGLSPHKKDESQDGRGVVFALRRSNTKAAWSCRLSTENIELQTNFLMFVIVGDDLLY